MRTPVAPRRERFSRLLLVALAIVAVAAGTRSALALFTSTASVPANVLATDTLGPPTGLSATGGASISLSWTATGDTYATGYNVLRGTASGGPYTQITQVTPRTATTYADSPTAGTYYYVLRSYAQSWTSANSNQASAIVSTTTNTGYRDCSANAPVTSSAGDNNGFQLNPANACADDGAFAEDTDSGTGTSTSCTNTGKDKHLYYNYGVSVPASSVINGIEVRLDGRVDATGNAARFCVELSWNGGTTWTTAKVMASDLTTTDVTYTLGTAADIWGRTWTPTELNDTNFRVRIVSRASNTSRDFRLEFAAVRVTYTPP